jgi:hypothetical protein
MRSVVRSLTLVSIRSDIRSNLDVIRKLDANETHDLTGDLEQQLALSTTLLFSILETSSQDEKKECQNTINDLEHYNFKITNDLTRAAINLLEGREDKKR